MPRPRRGFNPKRRLADPASMPENEREQWARDCSYNVSPYHKRNPRDFGLTPPASPRPGKTLCDAAGAVTQDRARSLLASGFLKGTVSEQRRNDWPKNVWAVSESRQVFEAQLENERQGVYHGYPLQHDDDFREAILKAWDRR